MRHQYEKLHNSELNEVRDVKLKNLYRNPVLDKIKIREEIEKEKQIIAEEEKMNLVQRKRKYAEFVRDMFRPGHKRSLLHEESEDFMMESAEIDVSLGR